MILAKIPNDFTGAVQADLASLRPVSTGKVGLEFRRRFWEEDDRIFGGITDTNMDIGTIWYPSHGYLGERGLIVGAYNFVGEADAFAGMTPKAREARALEQGRKVHGDAYVNEFVSSFSASWRRIAHSEGGWVAWDERTGSVGEAYARLLEPQGRVYFAGDHLTLMTAWQHGAFEIGAKRGHPVAPAGAQRMKRGDLGAWRAARVVGAAVALIAVLIWTEASRPALFPTTTLAAVPTPFVAPVPVPTPRPELPISLDADGLGTGVLRRRGRCRRRRSSRALLGTPNADEHWTCPDPAGEVRFLQWADLGVFVIDGVFVGWVDAMFFPPEFGPPLNLKTVEDLYIDLELEHFEAHLGDRFVFREPDPERGRECGARIRHRRARRHPRVGPGW